MDQENNSEYDWFYTDKYRDIPVMPAKQKLNQMIKDHEDRLKAIHAKYAGDKPIEKGSCNWCNCFIYTDDNFIENSAGLFCSNDCYIEAIEQIEEIEQYRREQDQPITDDDIKFMQLVHDHPVEKTSENIKIGNVSDLFSSDDKTLNEMLEDLETDRMIDRNA